MKKFFRIFVLFLFIFAFSIIKAYPVATIGGTIVKNVPSKRTMVIKLKSGSEKKVVLTRHAKAYKLNQPALFSSFHPGEYVVVKICNPINESPWQAEIIMDNYSAKQYSAYRTITPTHTKTAGGGFATSAGAAPEGLPPVTGVYPNATNAHWPNNNQLPSTITWGQPKGKSSMKAAPSPWGSPAMGSVLSGPQSENSQSISSGGGVSYDTGPAAAQPGGGTGSIMNEEQKQTEGTNLGITPGQGAWAANPTQEAPTRKMINFQGKVRRYDAAYNAFYVMDMSSSKIYTVKLRNSTKITDYFTKQSLTPEQVTTGKVVAVSGVLNPNKIVEALQIRVQR